MTRIKICGLTQAEDVRLCCRLGAWAVGFVLTKSPRQVDAEQAGLLRRAVAESASTSRPTTALPLTVGVFSLETAEHIAALVAAAGLDAVQLSAGSDGPSVAEVRSACAAAGGPSLAAGGGPSLAAGGGPSLTDGEPGRRGPLVIAAADTVDAATADLLLFDSRAGGRYGGTGEPLDWQALAARLRDADASTARPTAETAAAEAAQDTRSALRLASRPAPVVLAGGLTPANVGEAVSTIRPYAVDVSGGVERAPGVKDAALLGAFFTAVGDADGRSARDADRDPDPVVDPVVDPALVVDPDPVVPTDHSRSAHP